MSVDKELVERITREVMKRLEGSAQAPAVAAAPAGGGLLVVYTSGASRIDEIVAQIKQARARFSSLTVYLSTCSETGSWKGGTDSFVQQLGPDRVLREAQGAHNRDALSGVSAVAFPVTTMTTAAKIGMLIADAGAPMIAMGALMRRIPVVVSTHCMLSSVTREGYTPPQFGDVYQEHLARLKRVGVLVGDLGELAGLLSGTPSSAGGDSLTVAPSYSAAVSCAPVVKQVEEFLAQTFADDPSCAPCGAKVRQAIEKCIEAGACRIGTSGQADSETHTGHGLAGMIDHTLLKADARPQEIEKLCAEARKYHFKSVCVNPGNVALAHRLLRGSGVLVCTVVGFPLGATTTGAKSAETRDAVADGADEIDMVINIGALKAGDFEKVKHDIEAVVEAAKGRVVKVILETHLLTDEEKVAACQLSKAAGAHFVKTSTGVGGGGATAEDIALMRKVVGPSMGVKASGGVRTKEDAEKMVAAGANRIGASASVAIATGKKSDTKGY